MEREKNTISNKHANQDLQAADYLHFLWIKIPKIV